MYIMYTSFVLQNSGEIPGQQLKSYRLESEEEEKKENDSYSGIELFRKIHLDRETHDLALRRLWIKCVLYKGIYSFTKNLLNTLRIYIH